MPAIAITHRSYSDIRQLVEHLETALDCPVYTDSDLLEITARDHHIKPDLLGRVARGKSIPFNNFTHDREKSLSALMKTLAARLGTGNCIFTGIISHLIPPSVTHVFRILKADSSADRIANALNQDQQSKRAALATMEKHDRYAAQWTEPLRGCSPWDPDLYHMVIQGRRVDIRPDIRHGQGTVKADNQPDNQTEMIADQVIRLLDRPPFSSPQPREQEYLDFKIVSDVAMILAPIARGISVSSSLGKVTVTLDKKVMNLVQIQQKIMAAASSVEGVGSVKIKIGPDYYRGNLIRNFDFGRLPGYGKTKRKE